MWADVDQLPNFDTIFRKLPNKNILSTATTLSWTSYLPNYSCIRGTGTTLYYLIQGFIIRKNYEHKQNWIVVKNINDKNIESLFYVYVMS